MNDLKHISNDDCLFDVDESAWRRLIEKRGGCSCCISPPCSACSEPIGETDLNSVGYTYEQPVASEPSSGERAEDCCQACAGSGEVRALTSYLGPDDYEYDAECGMCGGTGSSDIRDAINALGWWKHTTDITRIVIERSEVLRILDARAALLSSDARKTDGSRESRMVVLQRDEAGTPTVWCDPEITDLVAALNNGGVPTVASCSGHGGMFGGIALKDGRELLIFRGYEQARSAESILLSSDAKPASELELSDAAKAGINCMSAWPFKTQGVASEPVAVPKSYQGSTLTSGHGFGASVHFHFSNAYEADKWFNAITDPQPVASEPSSGERAGKVPDGFIDDIITCAHQLSDALRKNNSDKIAGNLSWMNELVISGAKAAALLSSDAKPASEPVQAAFDRTPFCGVKSDGSCDKCEGSCMWFGKASEPCGCRIGECETKAERLCRMTVEIAENHESVDPLKLHAIEELCQLGYVVKDGVLYPPDHLGALMVAAGHPLAESVASEPVAVPQGWKLVPVEPTGEMLEAGQLQYQAGDAFNAITGAAIVWEHMLSAAPSPAPVGINGLTEAAAQTQEATNAKTETS